MRANEISESIADIRAIVTEFKNNRNSGDFEEEKKRQKDKIIKIIHDLAVCNETIKNCYYLLYGKLLENRYPDTTIEEILKNIKNQVRKADEISKTFFKELA